MRQTLEPGFLRKRIGCSDDEVLIDNFGTKALQALISSAPIGLSWFL
jgi:hypothetical protein